MKKIGLGTRPSEIKERNKNIDLDAPHQEDALDRRPAPRTSRPARTATALSPAKLFAIVLISVAVSIVITIGLMTGFTLSLEIEAVRFASAGKEFEVKNGSSFTINYSDGLHLMQVIPKGFYRIFPPQDIRVEIAGIVETVNHYHENLIPLLKPEEKLTYDVLISQSGQPLGKISFTLAMDAQAWIARADSLEDKKFQILCYQRARDLNPESEEAHIALGRLYESEQKYQQAIPEYEAVIRIKPDNVQALQSLVKLYKKTGKTAQVIDLYEKLAKIDSAKADDYNYQAGLIAENQGSDARALELYQNALASNKAHVDARQRVIKLYEKNKQWKKAIEHAQMLLELNPKNADLYLYISDIYAKQNNLPEALKAAEQAQKLRPSDAAVNLQLALLYEKSKNEDKAIEYYKKALTGSKKNAAAYNNLGLLLEKKGNLKEAIEYYETALKIDPKNFDVYRNLGDAYEKNGNIKKAIEIYEKLLSIDKNNLDALEALAILNYKAGAKEKSLEAYRGLSQLEPKKVLWHQKLAYLYEDLGKIDSARDEYKTILSLDPNNTEAKQKYVELAKRKIKTKAK